MSKTYGTMEVAQTLAVTGAATFGSTVQATGKVTLAGGSSICSAFGKIGTAAAGSITLVGEVAIAAGDSIFAAIGIKLSGALIKTIANMKSVLTVGAGKVIHSSVKACSNGLLQILFNDLT